MPFSHLSQIILWYYRSMTLIFLLSISLRTTPRVYTFSKLTTYGPLANSTCRPFCSSSIVSVYLFAWNGGFWGGIASISPMETKLCGLSSSSHPFELNTVLMFWTCLPWFGSSDVFSSGWWIGLRKTSKWVLFFGTHFLYNWPREGFILLKVTLYFSIQILW